MPISSPFMLNSGPPELPGLIDVSIWMQSVYSSIPLPLRRLVAVDAADQAEGHGRREVGGQQERVAHRQRPVAGAGLVAVAERHERERRALLLGQQLDEGHVADLVQADEDGVVELAVGQAALHDRAGRGDDVEVGQGVALGVDEHAGAGPLAAVMQTATTAGLTLSMTAIRSASAAASGLVRLRRRRLGRAHRERAREAQRG